MDKDSYEIVILGTGPAGLQAAIHAARSKVSVLVMGRKHKSSLYRAHVENYCCLTGLVRHLCMKMSSKSIRMVMDLIFKPKAVRA